MTEPSAAAYLDANRRNWDERAAIHARDETGFYRIGRFLAGEDILYGIEAAELPPLQGKRVAHLQCHIGLDTLSLARRGARVVGLDFSPTAIEKARAFALESGLGATFVLGSVYDARNLIDDTFDLVYVTWGTISWLPDVRRWAAVAASLLREGGRLYFADTHPGALAFEEIDGVIRPAYGWRTPADAPLAFDEATTYTGAADRLDNRRSYEWIHPLSEILTGLAEAGLRLDFLHEHELLPYRLFPSMVPAGDRLFALPPGAPSMPLAISLMATKR